MTSQTVAAGSPVLLTVAQLAERLQVSQATVYRLTRRGMPHRRVGQQIRFDVQQVDQWLDQPPTAAPLLAGLTPRSRATHDRRALSA